ncbi:MAG: glycosyltransferase family 39 protein, partial [Cyanobacteria bacterium]|nr:glycosyltransferase family 39 protein [Cyanobacteriota bacterium]
MASPVHTITSTDESRLTRSEPPARWRKGAAICEGSIVFALALTLSVGHLYVHQSPNLCLLFDGTGYLATANGLMQATSNNSDLARQIANYYASGCAEPVRLKLVEHLAAANGITWSGPIVPMLLSASYALAGKTAVSQYWTVGTWAMWILESLTICLVWLSARMSFNSTTARIAAALACGYAPFIINSTRISAETPACFLITLSVAVFLYFARGNFARTRSIGSGVLYGAILGLTALSRSQLLLMPVLFLAAIPIIAVCLREKQPFSKKWIAGIALGASLTLAPWAACNQIFTGKFSIAVDRSSAYNLYCGLSTRELGYDTLPNECVSDPKKFKQNMSQVLREVAAQATMDPMRFATAMALKPIRLLDAPWNDFKVDFWSCPFPLQRLYHQTLLLLSCLGLFCLIDEARKKKSPACRLAAVAVPVVLAMTVLYQFINCAAISMSRYFYPIMPVVVLLASYGCWRVFQSKSSTAVKGVTIGTAALLPLSVWLMDLSGSPACSILQTLALSTGIDCVAAVAALGCLAALSVFFIVSWKTLEWQTPTALCWTILFVACGGFCVFGTFYGVRQTEYFAELRQTSPVTASVPVASLPDQNRLDWFLVFDPLFYGSTTDAYQQLQLKINGVELDSRLVLPLMAIDRSQRSSFEYQKSFAHSGGVDVPALRQWFAVPVADGVVRESQNNLIEIGTTAKSSSEKSYLACDFLDRGGFEVAPRDLRKFSWTLGFAANPPYDMRMIAYGQPGAQSDLAVGKSDRVGGFVKPRVKLLGIERAGTSDFGVMAPAGEVDTLELDGGIIPGQKGPLLSQVIPAEQLSKTQQEIKSDSANSTFIEISGTFRAVDKNGSASVCLITTPKDSSKIAAHIAPMAPDSMRAERAWKRFAFIDVIPFEDSSSATPGDRRFACRTLMGGRSWWDILQYASFKVRSPIEFI